MLWLTGAVHRTAAGIQDTDCCRVAGILLGTTCLLQIGVSLALDSRYEKGAFRHFFWMIWYPLRTGYSIWLRLSLRSARPDRRTKKRARWVSPEEEKTMN